MRLLRHPPEDRQFAQSAARRDPRRRASRLNDRVRYVRLIGDDVGTYGVDDGGDLATLSCRGGNRERRPAGYDRQSRSEYLIEQWNGVRPFVENGSIHHVKLPCSISTVGFRPDAPGDRR